MLRISHTLNKWFIAALCLIAIALQTAEAAVTADTQEAIKAYLDDYQNMAAFNGVVLIAEGDEIVWQQAFGLADYRLSRPLTIETRFRLAALSEQVTKAAIGQLIDEDKLSLRSRLADFLPDFPQARRITIEQLLNHTAGIVNTDSVAWMDMTVPLPLDDIVAALATEKLRFRPGIDREYSAGGYALLARIIELASGMSYGEFINETFAAYSSLGHELPGNTVPGMATRYTPGHVYGQRVAAPAYVSSNTIGAGSLYATAEDVFRFYRDSFSGRLLSEDSTARLFEKPESNTVQFSGRPPGTLAQVIMDFATNVTVVVLSANSAGPANPAGHIAKLYRGETHALQPFTIATKALPANELPTYSGRFRARALDRAITIDSVRGNLVFIHGNIRSAFARTADGQFYLPLYDWLCRFSAYNTEFTCRSRDLSNGARVLFERQ